MISVTCVQCGTPSYFARVKESSPVIHLSDWGSWVWWIIPKSIIANLRLLFFRLFTDQWVFRLILDLTPLLSVYMVFIMRWQRESFRRQITFREGRQASSRCAVILDTFHSGVGKQHGGDVWCPCWARRDGALSVSWHNHSEPQPCLRQLNQTALYLWSGWVDLIAIFIGSRSHKSSQWGRLYRRDHSSFASSLGNIVSGAARLSSEVNQVPEVSLLQQKSMELNHLENWCHYAQVFSPIP